MVRLLLRMVILIACLHPRCCSGAESAPVLVYEGLANASAAVSVGPTRFITGCDEDNVLKLYEVGGRQPLSRFEASPWLGLQTRNGEADFEGAARIGDVAFWIGSHGRNSSGDRRPDRQRLVAFRMVSREGKDSLELVGQPVRNLLEELQTDPGLALLDLRTAATRTPDHGGLNIEGLAEGANRSLVLGLRGPLHEGRAVLIPLLNPLERIQGKPAQLAAPVFLDLGGRGIRDLVRVDNDLYILAGSPDGGGKTHLYRWSGNGREPGRVETPKLKGLNPEALVLLGEGQDRRLLVLSDDGNLASNRGPEPGPRTFRAVAVPIPDTR
jgi:hypothetical protein